MRKIRLYIMAVAVLLITLLIIIFGGIYFGYENLKDVGNFVSPLIGGVLGGIITLIGIELSRAHSEELQEKSKMQEVCPYFVIEVVETIYKGEFDGRFPWGGDPPPSDCYEILIDDGASDAFRVYLLTRLHNIGYGIGRNVKVYQKFEEKYHVSYVAEKSYDFHRLYFVVDCDPFGDIEETLYLEFEDYLGRGYTQKIKINLAFHDQMMCLCEMISGRPEPRAVNE